MQAKPDTCSKDTSNLCVWICIIACDQCSRGIIHDGCDVDRNPSLPQRSFEHGYDIVAFNAFDIKAFGPPLKHAMVDGVLLARVGESET